MDESGDFWCSVTTEMTVRHNKREPAPPAAFQSVLAVAAAVMQRGTPQKKKSLTGKSGKAQPVPPTGIEPVRCFHRGILSPLRLPVPPRRLLYGIVTQNGGIVNPQSPAAQSVKKRMVYLRRTAKQLTSCGSVPVILYVMCFLYPPTSHIFHIVRCAAADTGNRAMPQVMQEHQRRDAPGQRVCPEDDPDIMDKV